MGDVAGEERLLNAGEGVTEGAEAEEEAVGVLEIDEVIRGGDGLGVLATLTGSFNML